MDELLGKKKRYAARQNIQVALPLDASLQIVARLDVGDSRSVARFMTLGSEDGFPARVG